MSSVYIAPDDPTFEPLGFDLSRNESHSHKAEKTKHPVEDGTTISDHVIVEPGPFSVEVGVSNTPSEPNWFGEGRESNYAVDVVDRNVLVPVPFLQGVAEYSIRTEVFRGFGALREANRVLEMQEKLIALVGQLCSVLTSTVQYDSYVFLGFELQRGPLSHGSGFFKLSFEPITIVSTKLTKAPRPKEVRANKIVDKGKKEGSTEEAPPETQAQKRSRALKLFDAVKAAL